MAINVNKYGNLELLPIKSISVLGRDVHGVRVMRFKEEKDAVSSVTLV